MIVTSAFTDGPYGSQIVAMDAATGRTVWSRWLGGGSWWSGATYDDGRVFVANHDRDLRALDAATGAPLWTTRLPGSFTSRRPGRSWARTPTSATPALSGSTTVHRLDNALVGLGADHRERWRLTGDDVPAPILGRESLATPPLIAGGLVYVGSTSGLVQAVDLETGEEVWRGHAGGRIWPWTERVSAPRPGLGAGEGRLAVPTVGGISVLVGASGTGSPDGAGGTDVAPPHPAPPKHPHRGKPRRLELAVGAAPAGTALRLRVGVPERAELAVRVRADAERLGGRRGTATVARAGRAVRAGTTAFRLRLPERVARALRRHRRLRLRVAVTAEQAGAKVAATRAVALAR